MPLRSGRRSSCEDSVASHSSNQSVAPIAGQPTIITCKLQVKCYCRSVARRNKFRRRSECPLNASVEMLGDRWSLLIIRDMMLRGFRSYKEFMECYEGIATNILADRLRKLVAYGIITAA